MEDFTTDILCIHSVSRVSSYVFLSVFECAKLHLWRGKATLCLSLFVCVSLLSFIFHLSVRWSSLNRIPVRPNVCTQCSTWTPAMRCTPTATSTTCRSAHTHTTVT